MLLCHTGNSFEGLRNQMCFLTRAGAQLLSAQCSGFVLHKTVQSQAVRVGVRVYARRTWGRSSLWLKVIDPISGGNIAPTKNNNLCPCLETR